jgi:acyl-CoA reductase-like NAD-dependent aldehyde dehydrogenase
MTNNQWLKRAESTEFTINNVINGESIPTLRGDEPASDIIEKYSSRDGRLLYRFARGTSDDVDQAVAPAREAYDDGRWSKLSVWSRAAVLNRLADLIEEHHDSLVLNECLDVGKAIGVALKGEIARATGRLRNAAELAPSLENLSGADLGHMSYLRRKPVGVVAGIVGWNYPLAMAAGKVAPALVMGNTLVLKPSEFTSLSTQMLATLALEAGMPPGVLNVVHGAGATVGAAISAHKDIDLVSFVGSTATGRQVMAAAGASNMKRVILECGGKSPYIVFDDCPEDLDAIAQDIVDTSFPNQGALCVASSRLLLQAGIRDRLLPLVIEKAAALVPGDPLNLGSNFGALMNEAHMNKVLSYIDTAQQQGAELLLGGERVYPEGDPDLRQGFYVPPTIFDKVSPTDTIAQEEIFGPVLAVMTFNDEEEAIAIANGTEFGLSAYAATTDLARAQRLGAAINSGSINILGTTTPSGSGPYLGSDKHRQSGMGQSGGIRGLEAYAINSLVNLFT